MKLERLSSAATGEFAVYVDLSQYTDNEENHDIVDEAIEQFTDVDIVLLLSTVKPRLKKKTVEVFLLANN